MKAVRVLVVAAASSVAGMRRLLHRGGVEVVATASTATGALTQLPQVRPDVVILDLELTHLDPLALLAQLVHTRLAPVLGVISGSTASPLAERAFEAGVWDVVSRRSLGIGVSAPADTAARAWTLRIESIAATSRSGAPPPIRPSSARELNARGLASVAPRGCRLAVIGASTGGTQALTEILRELPATSMPVLVVQHMLPEFTRDFAERLNDACHMEVREAQHGDGARPGRILVAPGGHHMRLGLDLHGGLCVFLSRDAPVGKHRPSVDVLFASCADAVGPDAVGILLTGMGDDGARGLLAMRAAGAHTIVQDQASAVCVGMPSAAINCGAAQEVLPLHCIARALMELQTSALTGRSAH